MANAVNINYERGTDERPAYVGAAKPFTGACKVFPRPLQDGREPFFLGYQKAWMTDDHIMLIAEKSRQIGWTWTTSHGLARRHAMVDYHLDTWGTSRDDLQAQLAVQDCCNFANVLHGGAQDLGMQVLDKSGSSGHVLAFANGTKYYSLSSNPDAQAGKRGNRVSDEFALNKNNRMLYGIMEPGITWGGSIWVFSTHRGSDNYHNTLIMEARFNGNPKDWHVYRVTLQDALECGFLYKLQSKLSQSDKRMHMDEQQYFDFVRSKAADEETFLQEYMCVPSDDSTSFVSYALLDGACYAHGVDWKQIGSGRLYLGVDIGRTKDLTCFWLEEVVNGISYVRRVITLENTPFSEQEAVFYGLMDSLPIVRACVDATGIGRQFAERGAQRYGYRVEPILFSASIKEEMAYPVKASLEDHTRLIPRDEKIIADFRSIRKTTTSSNNIRFDGDRGTNGHADRFWACGLCDRAQRKANTYCPAPSVLKTRGSATRLARYMARKAKGLFGDE